MIRSKSLTYLAVALLQAGGFAKDPQRKVGAILLRPGTLGVLAVGFNGIPRGVEETADRWARPAKYLYAQHAEANVISNCALDGISTKGAWCVSTLYPCVQCAGQLIQAGISRVLTIEPNFDDPRWGHEFKASETMFREARVEVELFARDEVMSHFTQLVTRAQGFFEERILA